MTEHAPPDEQERDYLTGDEILRLTAAASRGRNEHRTQQIHGRDDQPHDTAGGLPPWATQTFPDAESRAGCLAAAVRDFGLDPALADRVTGDTPLDLARDVETLAASFPAPAPVPDLRALVGTGHHPAHASASAHDHADQAIREARRDNPGSHFTL